MNWAMRSMRKIRPPSPLKVLTMALMMFVLPVSVFAPRP